MLAVDGVFFGWRSTVLGSAILMLVLSIVLAWVPLLGPLVAGAVGAYFCGNVRRALLAAVVPAILLGVFLWWRLRVSEHGFGGIFVAVGFLTLVLADEIGLWAGVVLGCIIASRRHHHARAV
jgi:hypothetical protein